MRRFVFETTESVRIATQQIRANRTRSFLTALGVVIGIIAITLMGTALRGIDTGVDNSLRVLGDDIVYVTKQPWRQVDDPWVFRNRPDIKTAYAERLNAILAETPNTLLELAVPADTTFSNVRAGENQVNFIFTLGINHDVDRISKTDMAEGRAFNEAESRGARQVAIIGFDVADALFPGRSAVGERITFRGQSYEVLGVVARQGSFLGLWSWDSMVGIPLATFQKNIAINANAEIRVKIKDKTQLEAAKLELTGHMRRIRALGPEQRDNFEINDQGALRSTLDPLQQGVAMAGLLITGLSLFVGAIGIMNITYVSVKERTREIGTRKALGARRRTILLQFLIEAVSICAIGGVVGLLVAWLMFHGAAAAFPAFPISFSLGLIVAGMAVSIATGIVSGFLPAWTASKLDPVEALRYE